MEQRISVLTLAVDDLVAMKDFYSNTLGWKVQTENKNIVFYQLNGCLLSLCDKKILADFIGLSTQGEGHKSTSIGYNVASSQEVLRLYDELKNRVKILKEPTSPPFGGLFFYFSDIEGNVLEIAYNPFVQLDAIGNVLQHLPIDSH